MLKALERCYLPCFSYSHSLNKVYFYLSPFFVWYLLRLFSRDPFSTEAVFNVVLHLDDVHKPVDTAGQTANKTAAAVWICSL